MRSLGIVTTGRSAFEERKSRLQVFLVYEDLETGLRAKEAFDHALLPLNREVETDLNMANFRLLGEPAFREEVARQIEEAGIVLLSAHGYAQPPGAVQTW